MRVGFIKAWQDWMLDWFVPRSGQDMWFLQHVVEKYKSHYIYFAYKANAQENHRSLKYVNNILGIEHQFHFC